MYIISTGKKLLYHQHLIGQGAEEPINIISMLSLFAAKKVLTPEPTTGQSYHLFVKQIHTKLKQNFC